MRRNTRRSLLPAVITTTHAIRSSFLSTLIDRADRMGNGLTPFRPEGEELLTLARKAIQE